MKNYEKAICYVVMLTMLSACSTKTEEKEVAEQTKPTVTEKKVESEVVPALYLQPLGSFSQGEAEQLKKELDKRVPEILRWKVDCVVLPNIPLDNSLRNDAKTRFRAEKILDVLAQKGDKKTVVIGLAHDDISTTLRGQNDWGIQGLSRMKANVCVVSTFRLKNKADFWKLACHELTHTRYNYNHCPKNDPACIIQNANGHPNYSMKTDLCDYCKKKIFGEE